MIKQIIYVILNEDNKFLNAVTKDGVFWTDFLKHAFLFENDMLAHRENKKVKGTVKRLNYSIN